MGQDVTDVRQDLTALRARVKMELWPRDVRGRFAADVGTKERILNTPTARAIKHNSYATLDQSPFMGGDGAFKTEFEEQLDINLGRYDTPQEAVEATMADIGMGDTDARDAAQRIIIEAGLTEPDRPMGGHGEPGDSMETKLMGRDEMMDRGVRNITNAPAHQNNPNTHEDSYQGMPVQTQMAFASQRIAIEGFDWQNDDAEDNEGLKKKRIQEYMERAKPRLRKRYRRIPLSDDKLMGRGDYDSYNMGGTGWDTSGPSVGGTDNMPGMSGLSPFAL